MYACSRGVPVPGKRAREKESSGFLHMMSVSPASLQLWWESSGHWPSTAPVKWGEEWGKRWGVRGDLAQSFCLLNWLTGYRLVFGRQPCIYATHSTGYPVLMTGMKYRLISTLWKLPSHRTVVFQSSTKSMWWRKRAIPNTIRSESRARQEQLLGCVLDERLNDICIWSLWCTEIRNRMWKHFQS